MVVVMVSEPEVTVATRAEVVMAEELAAAYRIGLVIDRIIYGDIIAIHFWREHFLCEWI